MRIGRSFRFRRIKPSHFVGDVQRVCPGNSWEQAGSRQQCPAPDRLHVSGLDFQGWRADGWFGAFCLEIGASLKGGRSQETCLLPCFSLLPSTPANCLEWYIFLNMVTCASTESCFHHASASLEPISAAKNPLFMWAHHLDVQIQYD